MNAILDFSTSDSTRTSIFRIAGALTLVQLFFPPKVWDNGFVTQSLGHVFIFSDPMAGMNQMAAGYLHTSTSIAWVQLVLQLVVTVGAAFGIAKYLEAKGK